MPQFVQMSRVKAPMPVRVAFLLILTVWSVFIFARSSKTAGESSEESSNFIKSIAQAVDKDFDKLPADRQLEYIENMQFIVRKAAHFTVYALLGFLSAATAAAFGIIAPAGFIYCILYAASDEIHQYFVPGRSCELRDFFIDSSGALVGIVITVAASAVIRALRARRRQDNFSLENKKET